MPHTARTAGLTRHPDEMPLTARTAGLTRHPDEMLHTE